LDFSGLARAAECHIPEGGILISRIHVNDLAPTDGLTPEQEEQVLEAGRKSFRPMLESLEGRELDAAGLGSAMPPECLQMAKVAQGTFVQSHTPVNQIQIEAPAATSALAGR
jgi:hypothetical protein